MAFTFTALSRNKVRFVCDGLAVDGTAQLQDLAAHATTLPLLGGALPPAGPNTTDNVRAHLDVTIDAVTNDGAPAAEGLITYLADVEAVANVPNLRCSVLKAGAALGIIRGTIERVQSRDL